MQNQDGDPQVEFHGQSSWDRHGISGPHFAGVTWRFLFLRGLVR